ncbi:TPA_asm: ATP-binding cassette domain-containing protein [Salmonella enterica subsp. enterica serovar Typhimurium str. SL1344]|uniref:ATP-binding cassette domain-containing protein n=1 Tax=Salmonella typhimurium (strain SL1344) TaxID=216597 RepID=A0A718HZI7_SALTS|nr:ATP-binding cassette domain-containing protein [Salmonella enterica subsp. enterica serovar Typhimurium str. SL1344]
MIEFNHVSKTFGDQQAVSDLNLHFSEGSFSVLIGTSGSGKSTTLKMINRLVEHDSGTIRFAGEEIRSLPVLELRRRMGYAIQSIGLFPHWTVAQNIATVPQLQKWSRARINDRIDELMALLGLESALRDRYPHQPSAGSSGLGMSLVDKRLREHFGDDYGISVACEPDCFTRITLRLPLEEDA